MLLEKRASRNPCAEMKLLQLGICASAVVSTSDRSRGKEVNYERVKVTRWLDFREGEGEFQFNQVQPSCSIHSYWRCEFKRWKTPSFDEATGYTMKQLPECGI